MKSGMACTKIIKCPRDIRQIEFQIKFCRKPQGAFLHKDISFDVINFKIGSTRKTESCISIYQSISIYRLVDVFLIIYFGKQANNKLITGPIIRIDLDNLLTKNI